MEEWRDVKGYPGYQVSNLGRVRTHNKVTSSKKFAHRKWKDRILKPKLSMRDGYYRLELWGANGWHKTLLVHRLVAEAFIPHSSENTDTSINYADMLTVNHINRNKTDNRVENLEWLSLADNVRAAFALGLGVEKPCKLKTNSGEILSFKSQAEASRYLGRTNGYISCVIKNCRKARDKNGNTYDVIYTEEGA